MFILHHMYLEIVPYSMWDSYVYYHISVITKHLLTSLLQEFVIRESVTVAENIFSESREQSHTPKYNAMSLQ